MNQYEDSRVQTVWFILLLHSVNWINLDKPTSFIISSNKQLNRQSTDRSIIFTSCLKPRAVAKVIVPHLYLSSSRKGRSHQNGSAVFRAVMLLIHVLWCQVWKPSVPDSSEQTFQTFVSEFLISNLEPMQFFFIILRTSEIHWFGVSALTNTLFFRHEAEVNSDYVPLEDTRRKLRDTPCSSDLEFSRRFHTCEDYL